jgi:hypothetical protein
MKIKIVQSLAFFLIAVSFFSCKKSGAITVTVKQQSVGQPIVIADSVVVLVKNEADNNKFYIGMTSDAGIVVFGDVSNANYEISSEKWDGTNWLRGKKNIEMKNGQSINVDLLIQP